ncbi:hypothetical protein C0J52_20393, partial [Blattella germanica]
YFHNFLQDEVTSILSSVTDNLHGLLSDCAYITDFACLDSDLINLQQETQILQGNIQFLIHNSKQLQSTNAAMTELHKELVTIRRKYKLLQSEWDKQQEHLGKMQQDLFHARNQLQQQSQFCASLGAVMGNLLWKTSRIPPVVDMLLSGNKVAEFLSIVNGSLVSFIETYGNGMPGQCADESQYIMSFCGIVTNIAAAPAGRQFIANNPVGKDLIEQFSKALILIPVPSGNCLKRLLLMALYNTSINQNGLRFLQQQKDLLSAIAHDLQIDSTFDLKLMTLRLLQSLTYEIPNAGVLKNILKEIPIEVIQPMSKSSEPEMKDAVKEILENINRARQKYEKKASSHGDSTKCGCEESTENIQKISCGAPNCPERETSKSSCPAAVQCSRNTPHINTKCY